MDQKSYAEKLKDPRWQKKRLEVLNRDGWRCTECGNNTVELHVHHEKYGSEPWDVDSKFLKTLCQPCHKAEHSKPKTNVINIKEMRSVPKRALLSELLAIRKFSDKTENPKGLPGHIKHMWEHREKLSALSEEKFQERWGFNNSVKMNSDLHWRVSYDEINNECISWNLVLLDDSHFESVSLLGLEYIDIKNKDYYAEPDF